MGIGFITQKACKGCGKDIGNSGKDYCSHSCEHQWKLKVWNKLKREAERKYRSLT